MIKVTVKNRSAKAVPLSPVTSGAVGIPVTFTFTEDWDGLTKLAVFRSGDSDWYDMTLGTNNSCVVPHEVLEDYGSPLYIGVYGENQEGSLVIPTIWADAGMVEMGTHAGNEESADPTPTQWNQIQTLAETAAEDAAAARSAAETAVTTTESARQEAVSAASSASASETLAESYAKGSTGTRTGEDTDNAKYYKEQASSYAQESSANSANATTKATLAESYAKGGTNTRTGEDTDNAKYYKEQAASLLDTKVSKSGDTMTGALTVSGGLVNVKSTELTDGTRPSELSWGRNINFLDSAGLQLGIVSPVFETSGKQGVMLRSRRKINNANTDNSVILSVDESGNRSVNMTHPEAWLSALGLGEVSSDSSVANIVSSDATGYSTQAAVFRTWGKVAQLAIGFKVTSTGAVTTKKVCTLVNAAKPGGTTSCQVDTSVMSHAYISTSGEVYVTGNFSSTSTTYYIRATYLLA